MNWVKGSEEFHKISCNNLASSRPRPKLRTEQTKQQIQHSKDSPGSQSWEVATWRCSKGMQRWWKWWYSYRHDRKTWMYVWIRRTYKTKKYLKNTAIQEFVFQSSCHQLCFIASRHLSLNLRLFHAATEIRVEMLPESTDASRSEFSLQWWQRGGNVGQAVLKCITTEPWTTQKHHHNTTYSDLQRSSLLNYWSCATKNKQIKVK